MFNTFKFGTGHSLISIGLGAGAVSMSLNVFHAFHIALWTIPVIMLSEISRILLPFIAANRGWTGHLKITFGGVVLLCLLTTSAFLADSFASILLDRDHAAQVLSAKQAKIAELNAEIAATAEKASSKALNDMAAKEEVRAEKPGCGTNCLAYKERAAKAERREALEKEVKELSQVTENAAPVAVSGLGVILGKMTGYGTETGSALSMAIFSSVLMFVLDGLVYLIIPGTHYCREDKASAKIEAFAPLGVKTIKTEAGAKIGKQEAYRRLISHLLDMPEGSMLTSRRQLCKVILGTDKRKTTFNDWINSWIAKGDLIVVTSSKGELICLPKAA